MLTNLQASKIEFQRVLNQENRRVNLQEENEGDELRIFGMELEYGIRV